MGKREVEAYMDVRIAEVERENERQQFLVEGKWPRREGRYSDSSDV